MKPSTLSRWQENSGDKKEYKVPRITSEELEFEMKQMHEGEAKPLVNINEHDDAFFIEVAAPGLKNSDFNVSINDCVLTITCLHKESGAGTKAYRQKEFDFHCFVKEIMLPERMKTLF